ncbi:MAG: MFS transporter [Rhodobacterales bacterium]|nr:MAG: MFS transporter [Rhodobacterales bacterium]
MKQVLASAWALLLGMFLMMVGNGIQGTLLGVRGGIEDFSTLTMSIVMSAYFVGFLGGSQLAPDMIRRVGHVRVFAALGSTISAVLILYPVMVTPWAWVAGRVVIGFCFSGVYVTAESWLNNAADNSNRGKALSLYMIVQMAGIVAAQQLINFGDAGGFVLFIIPSVLVSLAFAPVLLSVQPTPAFETSKPMSLRELVRISPTASIGMILLGGVFAAQFGMASVYATEAGLTLSELSLFISTFYVAALVAQYPIGWLSDRVDRRVLIFALSLLGGVGALAPLLLPHSLTVMTFAAVLVGGASNPLYSLLLAYANDYLDHDDMAAASAGFVFINGVGAIFGPLVIGWLMGVMGPSGFWAVIAVLLLVLALYAAYRMTQRASLDVDTVPYAPVLASASPVAVELAQETYIARELEEEEDEE